MAANLQNMMSMLQNMTPRSNRSLNDLKNSSDQLSGSDGLALREWASQSPMVPDRDLTDPLGKALLASFERKANDAQEYLSQRLEALGDDRAALRNEVYEKRWGPTRIPIFNVILTFCYARQNENDKNKKINKSNKNDKNDKNDKDDMLNLTRYLTRDLGVPVDGTDATGASALYWAISTSPFAEPQFAQILFDAGGSVNQRNRFGETTAAEMVKSMRPGATDMMRWYVQHGGDVNFKDNDGVKPVTQFKDMTPGMPAAVNQARGPRQENDCANCGQRPGGETTFQSCAKCKTRRYCSRDCQRVDWPTHKASCTAAA